MIEGLGGLYICQICMSELRITKMEKELALVVQLESMSICRSEASAYETSGVHEFQVPSCESTRSVDS